MDEPWFRKEGFFSNPFSIKPAVFHDEVVGYQLEPVFEKMDEGTVLFVEAPIGTGKTTILKHIVRRYGGKHKLIYHSHTHSESLDVKKLIRGASFLGRVLGKMPKDMLLLLDEASDLTLDDNKTVLSFLESGNLKSVVYFGTEYLAKRHPPELKRMLNGNVIRFYKLSPEQAVEIVRKRIGQLPLINDDVIKQTFVRVNYSPRKLLQACEDLCRTAVARSAKQVTPEHVESVLGHPLRAKKKKDMRYAFKPFTHKVKVASSDNFNLANVRTYEQEMSLIKQEKKEKDT